MTLDWGGRVGRMRPCQHATAFMTSFKDQTAGLATSDPRARRPDFLLAMHEATWDNINRHILVVWQSVTALLASAGALYLSERNLIASDLASSMVVLAATWAVAHAIDSK